MLLRHHPLLHSIVAIRPRDLVEGTGSFLVLDLGLKCLLDLGPRCVILLLKLVDLSLTQCYCLFHCCQALGQALALRCQALSQTLALHDVRSYLVWLDAA